MSENMGIYSYRIFKSTSDFENWQKDEKPIIRTITPVELGFPPLPVGVSVFEPSDVIQKIGAFVVYERSEDMSVEAGS